MPAEGRKVSEFFPKTPPEYMFRVLNTSAKDYGVHFSGKDAMYNTHKALLATEYAKDQGKGNEFHAETFYTYFTEGRNVADPQVLGEIAERVGLEPSELVAAATDENYLGRMNEAKHEAARHGIRSTPTFIFDDKYGIVGAQAIKVFRDLLTKAEEEG